MKNSKPMLLLAAAVTLGSVASAQGDMVVWRIGGSGSSTNFRYYGQSNGIAAYSVSSQSCNIGNQDLIWTSGDGTTHPVISTNVYRLKDRRFEHIGQSWLKHGFCALCEGGCGNGTGGGCASTLRVGCADTYSASLNDGASGGPKFTVLPASGNHLHPDPTPTGNSTIRGRLQIATSDIQPTQNPGAEYIVEGMYIHYQDHQNGYAANNATWRHISFNGSNTMSADDGINNVGESGLYGWKDLDPQVTVQQVVNNNEAGSGIHGYYDVAARVWDNGDGTWDYSYAVYNLNSTQGADSFSVPSGGATITNSWFSDVNYHSGEPQDGTDWIMTEGAGSVTWDCTQTYSQNADANAINWGSAYSFGFTADAGPVSGVGQLNMFEPGVGNVLTFPIDGPGIGSNVGTAFCFGDGTGTNCPCINPGAPGEGCLNSSGSGAVLAGNGNASVSSDDVVLSVSQTPTNVFGLFFSGTTAVNGGNGAVFGDGLRCAGGQVKRLQLRSTGSAGATDSTVGISASDGAQAGQTRYYQFWVRDPQNGPCGSGFNLSSALSINWGA